METGLSINKYIFKKLSSDERLKELVGKNIYPIVAEEDVTFPFITFKKTSIYPQTFKTGVSVDRVNFEVNVAAVDYITTVTISERVRELFELRTSSYFKRLEFVGNTEDYVNSIYTQTLQFSAMI